MNIKVVAVVSLLCAGCADLNDPFETFYNPGYELARTSRIPQYTGPPLNPANVDPQVYFFQPVTIEQAKSVNAMLAQQGYHRIGVSMFTSNWATPHREAAAQMGRKLGADLVIYIMEPAGTRLQSVPHLTYEPGQSYSGTTSGVVGGTFGSKPTVRRRALSTRSTRRRKLDGTSTSSAT